MHIEKLEKIIFQVGKEMFFFEKYFFPFGTIIFSIFPHKKTGKIFKNAFLTCSWRFFRSNKSEQLKF